MELEIRFGKRNIRIDTANERAAAEEAAGKKWAELEEEVITQYSPETAEIQTTAFLRHAALNARRGVPFAIYTVPPELDKAA